MSKLKIVFERRIVLSLLESRCIVAARHATTFSPRLISHSAALIVQRLHAISRRGTNVTVNEKPDWNTGQVHDSVKSASEIPATMRIPALHTARNTVESGGVIPGNDRRLWKSSLQSDTSTLDLLPSKMRIHPGSRAIFATVFFVVVVPVFSLLSVDRRGRRTPQGTNNPFCCIRSGSVHIVFNCCVPDYS